MKSSKKLIENIVKQDQELMKDDLDHQELFKAVEESHKRYAKVVRTEDAAKDFSWIDVIEDALPSLSNIVEHPRRFIKSVNYLVKAELAKRTGPESLIHLATHSQYIKKIEKNGDIIPSKVLTSEAEEDLAIYENRFVLTLIKRLQLYVEKRYIFCKKFFDLLTSDITYVDDVVEFGDYKISINSQVKIDTPSHSMPEMEAQSIIDRVEYLRMMVNSFSNSQFMKELKGVRPIQPPIMQTNMLRKNPDYKACYDLWVYLGEQEKANMNFIVNEEFKRNDKTSMKYLNHILMLQILEAMELQDLKSLRYTNRTHEIRPLNTIDEKLFLNDKFKDYEFVRVDEQYYQDLISKKEAQLENKSEKVRKFVFSDDLEDIKDISKAQIAAMKLKARQAKEALREDKKIEDQTKKNENTLESIEKFNDEVEEFLDEEELQKMREEIVKEANKEIKYE